MFRFSCLRTFFTPLFPFYSLWFSASCVFLDQPISSALWDQAGVWRLSKMTHSPGEVNRCEWITCHQWHHFQNVTVETIFLWHKNKWSLFRTTDDVKAEMFPVKPSILASVRQKFQLLLGWRSREERTLTSSSDIMIWCKSSENLSRFNNNHTHENYFTNTEKRSELELGDAVIRCVCIQVKKSDITNTADKRVCEKIKRTPSVNFTSEEEESLWPAAEFPPTPKRP